MSDYNIFARFYDGLTRNVDYAARAAYFGDLIKPHIGEHGMLLDLACGTGSLSVELAKLGYEVIGVDRSAEMLSNAYQKSSEENQNILFLKQDMLKLDLYGDIDAAICALDSLNHLPDEISLERAISRVALFLRPGGVFAFDVNTPYKHREVLANNCFAFDTDEVYCVWQNQTRDIFTRITLDFFVPSDSGYKRYTESFMERAFDNDVIINAVKKCGLELIGTFDDGTELPPKETSERIIYLTRKI